MVASMIATRARHEWRNEKMKERERERLTEGDLWRRWRHEVFVD